jgi:hypothetical protein
MTTSNEVFVTLSGASDEELIERVMSILDKIETHLRHDLNRKEQDRLADALQGAIRLLRSAMRRTKY